MRSRLPASFPARRALVLAGLLVFVLALTLAAALVTRSGGEHPAEPTPSPPATGETSLPSTGEATPPARPAPVPDSSSPAPADPPRIDEPVAYAEAAATALWSYDTRTTSRAQHLAALAQWMTGDERYADWPSVASQVPDPTLWSRMADTGQRAAARDAEGRFPSAFQQALADDPTAITEAYVYAVTVTGTQRIAWTEPDGRTGASGTEERSTTLAVQCRPSRDCSLVAVSPTVMP
ncbi:hypothetical protein ACL02R_11545 [Streptomyces sp. MS19]|uniref:hypothetical protein n=1 Tax=Streptomyces sp. MS19 TaxID=3385972 RepID=UPI0039A304A3